ncbi:potassium-transporting ATPase subunit KdpB [Streptomyces sp. DSM 118878]
MSTDTEKHEAAEATPHHENKADTGNTEAGNTDTGYTDTGNTEAGKADTGKAEAGKVGAGLFDPAQLLTSLPDAFRKLHPRLMVKAPVMFVVLIGSVATTVLAALDPSDWFGWAITAWLWLTTLFANLAEAVAEGRGKAQADTLRRAKTDTMARRLTGGVEEAVLGTALRVGDRVVCEAGDIIPGDGDVVEGVASVDESAITGESAPVIRESGGDRSAVTGGTKVLSDRVVIEITTKPGETFIDRMINLVEGAARQKTPNEIALNILLASLTIVFLLAVVTLKPFASYAGADDQTSLIVLTALLVCLIPTTIGALLSAIGIAGMDRLVQRNVLAMSGRAVEAAGDVSTLLLDKTGTITLGNRRAAEFVPVRGATEAELADAAQLSSLADETPEGRSVVVLAEERYGLRERRQAELTGATWVPFTAQTRMSGVDVEGRAVRKGATASVLAWVEERGGAVADDTWALAEQISRAGGTPLLVAVEDGRGARVLGAVHLKDVVKEGMRERFDELRRMGIRTVMITGDNPLTAKAIAEEAGVDDFLAEATPEDKMALIKREQAGGKLVAMTGDGTNDAPALAQADVGVAMNTGTSAAKEAGNMVDLDSDPTKLIEIVGIGKQLLITRGALTTFSIANDVAKYFAIIPAMFTVAYPSLDKLNIMGLASPESAILSAVIFNALIIVALVPLALKGVRYRPMSADRMLRRNLGVYGLGGLVAPFIGIKIIDVLLSLIPGLG